MRRWIKPRSEGIAVIRKNGGGRPHLEYVFDYADTRPVRGAKEPYIWQVRDEHHDTVISALEQRYGPSGGIDVEQHLMEIASHAVYEVYRDYLPDVINEAKNSGQDIQGLEKQFLDVMTASVQYTVLTRCGLEPDKYLPHGALEGISTFSTPAVLHHLGTATSAVSMDMLVEIGKTIRSYDREKLKINKIFPKNLLQNRTLSAIIKTTENLTR